MSMRIFISLPASGYTHRLARLVIELLHRMTIKDVAHYLGLSWDTVKDIHKNYLNHKFSHIDIKDVKHIGIDEFALRRDTSI